MAAPQNGIYGQGNTKDTDAHQMAQVAQDLKVLCKKLVLEQIESVCVQPAHHRMVPHVPAQQEAELHEGG
jgi:hypothetical protein